MYNRVLKPLIDFIIALVLVILLLPIFIIVSSLIYIKMGKPVFFKQNRPGRDAVVFTMYKFRTMENNRNTRGELMEDKYRLNRFGKTIRSLSLDELPQLLNIIKGEMSFIGPRPLLIEYLHIYNDEQKKRHTVKPGISGWAQVNGRNTISWKDKLTYDVWYTKNMSFTLDLKIVFMTIKKVLLRKDISANRHITSEKFNGHN